MKDSLYSSRAFKSYVIGFIASLVLTLTVWLLIKHHVDSNHTFISHHSLIVTIITAALAQMIIQLVFFLHLGREKKPYWNLQALLAAAGVIVILILGSIWIMNNLNYSMTNKVPSQSERSF